MSCITFLSIVTEKKKLKDGWCYTGEIDENGMACGVGSAEHKTAGTTYEGFFYNDQWEGIGNKVTYNG